MTKAKLVFGDTLKETITIALKNFVSLLLILILYILTIWVPWINIGTTIAIMTLPVELGKGKIISPLSIFDAKYRKKFGTIFLTLGLMYIPIFVAMMFFIIPGIILNIAWGLAVLFVIDKHKEPLDAIMSSYKATDGSKWMIFGLSIVIGLIFGILAGLLGAIWRPLLLVVLLFMWPLSVSLQASIYRQLKGNAELPDEVEVE